MKVWKVFLTFALLFVTSEAQTGTPTPTANSTAAPTATPSATKTAAPTAAPAEADPIPTLALVIAGITIFLIILLLVKIYRGRKQTASFSQKKEGNGLEQEMLPRPRGGNDDTEPVTDLYTFKFGDALDASKTLHDNTLNNNGGSQNLNAFKFGDSIEDSMNDSTDLSDNLQTFKFGDSLDISKGPLKRNGSQDLSDTLQTSKTLSKNRKGTGVTFKLPKDIKDSTPSSPVDDYKTSRMKPPKPCLKQCDTDEL